MKIPYETWLLNTKRILVYLNIISADTPMSYKDWRHFYDDGKMPVDAVREDLLEGNIEMPTIVWSNLSKINVSL